MTDNNDVSPEQVLSELECGAFWTVKYHDPAGFECQLSLEAANGTDVLRKGEKALDRLQELGCIPVYKSIGQSTGEGTEKESVSFCPIHHVEMKLWKKENRSWYAHKVDGNWCSGK
jgi:hypothetical protein